MLAYYAGKAAVAAASKAMRPYLRRKYSWAREERTDPHSDAVMAGLQAQAIRVETFTVDGDRFRSWVRESRYPRFAYVVNRTEKFLEHFVSMELLNVPAHGTLIDVASCRSPFPEIVRARGYRVIAQDIVYPAGLHGNRLGGDAAAMPLPDACADGVTLHCSFEHFEGDADSRFARGIGRILKPGARAVILPLYVGEAFTIETDPLITGGNIPIDSGARLVGSFGYANRFGRHYDAPSLNRRVIQPAAQAGLNAFVVRIENPDVRPAYLRFALILERPV